jgi:predicted RNA-binding protein with PIN domain
MPLLIDGYNLLHVTGLVGRAGSGLQGSREALLRFLAAAIEPRERTETTIVFDAAEAPPGLPRTVTYEGMTVRYSSDYEDADALLEELIAEHHAPRSLTLVSSDHRVQRAARRRRAPFVDSDVWFAEALRRREQRRRPSPPASPMRRDAKLSTEEIDYWLTEFSAASDARRQVHDDLANPFPPGYGEDLSE